MSLVLKVIPWFPWPWVGRGVKVAACRGCNASYKVRKALADNASTSAAEGIAIFTFNGTIIIGDELYSFQ